MKPLVKAKSIHENRIRFFLSAEFSKHYINEPLALTYPREIVLANLPSSIVEIPLITNAIATIWFSGETYIIDEMDEDLYHSLGKIKEFYRRFFYNTRWDGELIPGKLVKNRIRKHDIRSASMFTGGVDSTCTVLRHFDEHPALISLNEPHEQAAAWAANHNLTIHKIKTNYSDFLNLSYLNKASIDITKWFWDTTMGLSWVGMSAPLLYAKGIPKLYIPSGFTWRSFMFPDGQTIEQPASPVIDENLSPIGLHVTHDDFFMTRTDKIKLISNFCSQHNLPKPQLVVCTHHGRANTSYTHCNTCFKCYITMLDILAIGDRLRDYGFTLSEKEFITQFQSYFNTTTLRPDGVYAAFLDTQRYLKSNIDTLPQTHRAFFDWYCSIDLWARADKSTARPLRANPFNWSDYADLYPGVKKYIDET